MAGAEQGLADLALAGAGGERVVDAQQQDRALDVGIAREQGRGEAAMPGEIEKAPQRQQPGPRAGETFQPIEEESPSAARETSRFDIEADTAPAVREDRMLAAVAIRDDGQPGCEIVEDDVVGIGAIGRNDRDVERARIEIGMPDDPGLRGSEVRTLGESEGPSGSDRNVRPIGPYRAWPCSRVCARRRNRDRGGAIPTSRRRGRCRRAAHRTRRRASRGATRPARRRSRTAPHGGDAARRTGRRCESAASSGR